MIEINKNYNESNLDTMAKMPNCFVDLTVTSPPYDGLRTYNGYSFPFEDIAKELFRITKQGGVLVWVIGDETKNFCESITSFKQAIYLKELGFNLLDTMIYYKQNYAPAYPTLRRYANQFEYMFVFSKGKPKTFNPIQKEKVRNKKEKVAYRQKDGTLKRKVKEKGRDTKDASNVWEFAVGGNLTGHPAVFPLQLAIDHILTWTNENDLVYDCFNGSGTTSEACIKNNRNWIGSEISSEYCEIIEERVKKAWEEKRKEKENTPQTLFETENQPCTIYGVSGSAFPVNRVWAMPSIWTFTVKPIKGIIDKYHTGTWADPFAGENSPAEITNDIEGRGAKYEMDALEFLKVMQDNSLDGCFFDPPYSTEQCLRRYTPKHKGTAGRAEYWAKCKDEIARAVKIGGTVMSFCWDSTGIGKKRGFEIVEILLVCHGACHNDTVITVERRVR